MLETRYNKLINPVPSKWEEGHGRDFAMAPHTAS
jgi:hypothetical protein